jgi:hypothetical protein
MYTLRPPRLRTIRLETDHVNLSAPAEPNSPGRGALDGNVDPGDDLEDGGVAGGVELLPEANPDLGSDAEQEPGEVPFVWTKDAETILAKARRKTTSLPQH